MEFPPPPSEFAELEGPPDADPEASGEEGGQDEQLSRDAPPKKRKGKSTRWNIPAHALQILEQVFQKDKFPTVETRKNLSADLKVTPRQVQVWFQNKRQRSVKPTSKGNVAQQPHEILNTSEDIRAALMNFGSSSVEATRPQHEVFANDEKVPRPNNASTSAAAEAWMAAAMHATQMQPAVPPRGSEQRTSCGSSDSVSPQGSGMNSWWRPNTSQPSRASLAILPAPHSVKGNFSGFNSGSSRQSGQWQPIVSQGNCTQGISEQPRPYPQGMPLTQMMQILSRIPPGYPSRSASPAPDKCSTTAAHAHQERSEDKQSHPSSMSASSVQPHAQGDSLMSGIPMSRNTSNRSLPPFHEETSSIPLSRNASNRSLPPFHEELTTLSNPDHSSRTDVLDGHMGTSFEETRRLAERGDRQHPAADQQQDASVQPRLAEVCSMPPPQSWQHMMRVDQQSRSRWNHCEGSMAHESSNRGTEWRANQVERGGADNIASFSSGIGLASSFPAHGAGNMHAAMNMDFESDNGKTDQQLMHDLSSGNAVSSNGDEFMDEIIETLFNEEITAMQHANQQMPHPPKIEQACQGHSQTGAAMQQAHSANQHMHHHTHLRAWQPAQNPQQAPHTHSRVLLQKLDDVAQQEHADHKQLHVQQMSLQQPAQPAKHNQHMQRQVHSHHQGEAPPEQQPMPQASAQSRLTHEQNASPSVKQMQELQRQMHQQIHHQQQYQIQLQRQQQQQQMQQHQQQYEHQKQVHQQIQKEMEKQMHTAHQQHIQQQQQLSRQQQQEQEQLRRELKQKMGHRNHSDALKMPSCDVNGASTHSHLQAASLQHLSVPSVQETLSVEESETMPLDCVGSPGGSNMSQFSESQLNASDLLQMGDELLM